MNRKNPPIEFPRPDTTEIDLKRKIEAWNFLIEQTAKKQQEPFCQFSYPGDKWMPLLRSHFESKGFRVSVFTSDEGYCIGYVRNVQISW